MLRTARSICWISIASGLFLAGCSGLGPAPVAPRPLAAQSQPMPVAPSRGRLGFKVFSKFGGTIFGWDIDQSGDDGLLGETVLGGKSGFLNAIEVFDERTGTVTKVVKKWTSTGEGPLPFVEAITGNDIGLIDGQKWSVKNSRIVRNDQFWMMSPVTGGAITGSWSPGHVKNLLPNFVTENPGSSAQVFMAYRSLHDGGEQPLLYPYDSASNTWGMTFVFPHKQVLAGYLLYAAIDTTSDIAVTSYSPKPYNQDDPLWFDVFNARTGAFVRSFKGHGIGFSDGMAIDSTTGIMCTDSEDMGIAVTDLSNDKGFEVQLPDKYGGGPLTNGEAIAVDPIHHLFLIAQLNSTYSPTGGSTVYVYDEKGKLIEGINGFEFLNANSPVVVHIAINPSMRLGFVPAQDLNTLQSFTY